MFLKKIYLSEVEREKLKSPAQVSEPITEKDIAHLPEPVQKYFRVCGYIGKAKMLWTYLDWKNTGIRLGLAKKWINMECRQFNSVTEPSRIVYMKSNLFGIFPFEGRDKFQDGHGNMFIKLLKVFTVADAKGVEMDKSALVTVLAEALIVPTYALQKYITWQPVDEKTARASLSFDGCTVSGIFHFNNAGEFIRFETNDRFYSEKGNEYQNIKWSIKADNYIESGGVKFPSDLKAIWNFDDGDYEYFKGAITNIRLGYPNLFD